MLVTKLLNISTLRKRNMQRSRGTEACDLVQTTLADEVFVRVCVCVHPFVTNILLSRKAEEWKRVKNLFVDGIRGQNKTVFVHSFTTRQARVVKRWCRIHKRMFFCFWNLNSSFLFRLEADPKTSGEHTLVSNWSLSLWASLWKSSSPEQMHPVLEETDYQGKGQGWLQLCLVGSVVILMQETGLQISHFSIKTFL